MHSLNVLPLEAVRPEPIPWQAFRPPKRKCEQTSNLSVPEEKFKEVTQ